MPPPRTVHYGKTTASHSEGGCSTRREFFLSVDSVRVLLTRWFSSSKIISIMFKSGDLGESRRHLHCLHPDMQWWPLPDGLEHQRAAPAFLCGFSTMELPQYAALHVDTELHLSSHL